MVIQEVGLLVRVCDSGSIFLQRFDTCGVSYSVFNKSVDFFEIENFSSGEFSSLGVIRSSTCSPRTLFITLAL